MDYRLAYRDYLTLNLLLTKPTPFQHRKFRESQGEALDYLRFKEPSEEDAYDRVSLFNPKILPYSTFCEKIDAYWATMTTEATDFLDRGIDGVRGSQLGPESCLTWKFGFNEPLNYAPGSLDRPEYQLCLPSGEDDGDVYLDVSDKEEIWQEEDEYFAQIEKETEANFDAYLDWLEWEGGLEDDFGEF